MSRAIEKQAFTVRLDAGTYLALRELADRQKRTVSAQVEVMIEEGLCLWPSSGR